MTRYESQDGRSWPINEAGRVAAMIAPQLRYVRKRDTFQTPSRIADDGFDPVARVGQTFEILGCDFSVDRIDEDGGGPLFTIRFPDGFVFDQATEEEVFQDGGWNP